MFKSRIILSVAVAGVFVAGCDNNSSTPATQPSAQSPAAPSTPATVTPPTVTTPAMPTTPTTPAIPAIPAIPSTPTTVPSASTDTSTTPAASSTNDDAKTLLAQTEKDVDAKNWDAAKNDLKQLSGMMDKMTPELKTKYQELAAKVAAGGSGISLPSIPGIGGTTPAQGSGTESK